MRNLHRYPLAWTLAAMALVWVLAVFGPWAVWAGFALMAGGVWLIGGAMSQMRAARTTVNPIGTPRNLVTGGVFAFSRNPIYLGFVGITAGMACALDSVLGVLVAAALAWGIQNRFILNEERILAKTFPEEFAQWSQTVPRWI